MEIRLKDWEKERFSKVIEIAALAHQGQTRKYCKVKVPYIEHPITVARTLHNYYFTDPHMLEAAYLHDVIEDTHWTADMLRSEGISEKTVQLVLELTKQACPEGCDHEGHIRNYYQFMSRDAAWIKIADRRDNLIGFLTSRKPEAIVRYAEDTALMFTCGQFEQIIDCYAGERHTYHADLVLGTEMLARDLLAKFEELTYE